MIAFSNSVFDASVRPEDMQSVLRQCFETAGQYAHRAMARCQCGWAYVTMIRLDEIRPGYERAYEAVIEAIPSAIDLPRNVFMVPCADDSFLACRQGAFWVPCEADLVVHGVELEGRAGILNVTAKFSFRLAYTYFSYRAEGASAGEPSLRPETMVSDPLDSSTKPRPITVSQPVQEPPPTMLPAVVPTSPRFPNPGGPPSQESAETGFVPLGAPPASAYGPGRVPGAFDGSSSQTSLPSQTFGPNEPTSFGSGSVPTIAPKGGAVIPAPAAMIEPDNSFDPAAFQDQFKDIRHGGVQDVKDGTLDPFED